MLADLAAQLPDAIEPATRWPAACSRRPTRTRSWPGAEREYRALVDNALVNHHTQALEVLVATAQADTLSEAELAAWLDAIGSLRLVLGTRLDVHEDMEAPDPDDPTAPEYALFLFLGELQYLMIEVLADDLPDEGRPEGAL